MTTASNNAHAFVSAFSKAPRPDDAALEAANECLRLLDERDAHFVLCFVSSGLSKATKEVAAAIRAVLRPGVFVGVTGDSVIGNSLEAEDIPAVSVLAAHLPGVDVRPFLIADLPRVASGSSPEHLVEATGFSSDMRAVLLFADPFSVPMNSLLPELAGARQLAGAGDAPILGGMASAGNRPDTNTFVLDDRLFTSGGIGITLSGPIRVDAILSQGCRPFGPNLVVTGCQRQLITSLGGRPAIDVLAEVVHELDEGARSELTQGGIFVGRAVSEYKERFGRGDFLIRNLIGVDKKRNAIAVAELLRVGQTIRFHTRDRDTASEDLALLLDGQKLYGRPLGALLFTCTGRGKKLFGRPNHDADAIANAFHPLPHATSGIPGEVVARPENAIPLAGFFAAGEIGPVGNEVHVHGQTASIALFRHVDE